MPNFPRFPASLTPRGLGAWLALAFSALTVVLTLLLVEVVESAATEQVKNSIGNGLGEMAMQTADKLDRGMYQRYREVRLMARRGDLVAAGASQAERRRILADIQSTYGYYEWIGMAALDGTVLVEARGLLEGKNVAKRPWFINALKGNYVGDVHEAVLLAKLLPVQEGEPRRFVDVAFPWLDADGKPAGVLGTHLSWEWARDIERSIIAPVQTRGRVQALIVSAEGVVLLGPAGLQDARVDLASLGEARKKRTGYTVERWPDGRDYLVGYAATRAVGDYPGLGWHVLVRQDIEDAYRPVRELRTRALWSGAALALLFSLAGLLLARRITRPLEALAASADRLRRGDSEQLVPARRGYTEVRQLSGALNALVSALVRQRGELQALNDTLEVRVEQRTQELERALASVRASEQRMAAIVGAAQDAFIAVDQRGMILDWNPAAERMFGWSRHDAVGWPLAEMILPERYRTSIAKALRGYHQSGAFSYDRRLERTVVNRQGAEFTVEVTVALAGEGEDTFFSLFLNDISERKKVDRMKSEFVSTVSHELRTPLTSIHASLSLLDTGMAGELPSDVAKLIHIASRGCDRLMRMVNDLLDIQKIEAGQMEYVRSVQPLAPMLRHAAEIMEGQAQQAGVALRLDLPPGSERVEAAVDQDRMVQVFSNLLSNAIKFTPAGKAVTVGLAQRPGWARLSVTDEGPGIPPAFQGRIFERFAQADGADSRQRSGTGLGLSISKAIVEEHNGTIGFETRVGMGTRFTVELPLG
ncbi:ATP-binding protein [Massilia sp. HP4]|uniref:ATP-binding protein n=1 Tax=Massilia sp. HP4 TaxID=2562316 RepID=UPI0010C0853E|nr:ATP-binding protein [Massilia sp. HP4]